jgi:hypothetical protein
VRNITALRHVPPGLRYLCAIADQGLNLSKAEASGAALQSLAVAQDRRLGIREVEQ